MIDDFLEIYEKSYFLLLYASYRIIRKLNPAFDPHQRLKLRSKASGDRQRLYNLKDATITALEMRYLPTGIGEIIGGVKVAAIAVTDYGIWAARARTVVSKSKKLNDDEKLNIYEKLAETLAKKDIRTILLIHEKYK